VTIVFITGMSGTGTSTVVERLAELGHRAIDLDEPEWSIHDEHGDWIWRENRVQRLLDDHDRHPLFVSGCPTNQVKFYDRFDHIVLLSAPREVIIERIRSRTTNSYGKGPGEMEDILDNLERVEPRLRQVATHEIDTRKRVGTVVAEILEIAGTRE
jgi:shikimate kinase